MKYGHVRLIARSPVGQDSDLLHPSEPFLLIRGQDQLGPVMVAVYKALSETAGADGGGLDELELAMREFQDANPGLVKLAD